MATKSYKKEFLVRYAELTGNTQKDAEIHLDNFQETLASLLQEVGDVVNIKGFAKFEKKTRAGRTGVNPQTGEPIEIKPSELIKATFSKKFGE